MINKLRPNRAITKGDIDIKFGINYKSDYRIMPCGKYRGQLIEKIDNLNYLYWALTNMTNLSTKSKELISKILNINKNKRNKRNKNIKGNVTVIM